MMIITRVLEFIRSERGAVLPTLAIAAPVILGMTALGADGSYYMMTKSNLQTAVDAAAYSAAWEVSQGSSNNMDYTAQLEAERNGFDPEKGTLHLEEVTQNDGQVVIQASIDQTAPLWFFSGFCQPTFHNPCRSRISC